MGNVVDKRKVDMHGGDESHGKEHSGESSAGCHRDSVPFFVPAIEIKYFRWRRDGEIFINSRTTFSAGPHRR